MGTAMRLILASGSFYRLELLLDAGYEVIAIPAGIDEPPLSTFANLDTGLQSLAEQKARAVCDRGVTGVIFAADTVGYVHGEVFGKPRDRDDALRMLRAISGTTHEVRTGWCLLRTQDGFVRTGVETTRITMREWTSTEFEQYLAGGEWQGKCGAYGLQLPHDSFVTHIAGSVSNVIGVPLERLREVLAEIES